MSHKWWSQNKLYLHYSLSCMCCFWISVNFIFWYSKCSFRTLFSSRTSKAWCFILLLVYFLKIKINYSMIDFPKKLADFFYIELIQIRSKLWWFPSNGVFMKIIWKFYVIKNVSISYEIYVGNILFPCIILNHFPMNITFI